MDTTISTNILFYAISIFLIFLTVGSIFLLLYVIFILKSINSFLNAIKKESEKIAKDISIIEGKIKSGREMFAAFILHILSFFKNTKKKLKK
jgi:Flp pilus assembly protein TadB